MAGKFEVKKGSNGEYFFNLLASNGQVILSSEGYTAKPSCINGIESVKKNSQDDSRFEKKVATNGKPYFNLLASNGQVIGKSQMYVDEKSRDNGIASVKTHAPDAPIIEE